MKLQTQVKFKFLKVYNKKNTNTGKVHNYIKLMDNNQEVHDFYLKPDLLTKTSNLQSLQDLVVSLNVNYGYREGKYNKVDLLDINIH